MYKVENPEFVSILNEIYHDFEENPQPIAMVEPEV